MRQGPRSRAARRTFLVCVVVSGEGQPCTKEKGMSVSAVGLSSSYATTFSCMQNMQRPSDEEMAKTMSTDLLSALDADGSGSLAVDETELTDEEFAAVDTDGDGLLSQEELESGILERTDELSNQLVSFMQSQGAEKGDGPPPGPPPEEEDDEDEDTTTSSLSDSDTLAAYKSQMQDILTSLFGSGSTDDTESADGTVLDFESLMSTSLYATA